MKRCAFCGGRLGLISHRKGSLRFCKRLHMSAYFERQRKHKASEDRRKSWLDFLSRRARLIDFLRKRQEIIDWRAAPCVKWETGGGERWDGATC